MRIASWPLLCVLLVSATALAAPRAAVSTKGRAPRPTPRVPLEPPPDINDEAPPPAPDDPDRERILRLQEALHSMVHGPVLGRVRTAIRVLDARSGRLLYNRRGDLLMDPASNQKILATAAALLRLGNNFRYRTEVLGASPDEEGVVAGDLYLRGSGDPSLTARDLEALASSLLSRGVTKVKGNLVADPRYLGVDTVAAHAPAPLHVSRSAIVVRVRPADAARARPHVWLEPAVEGIVVSNRATTIPRGRTRIIVTVRTQGGKILVEVLGRISLRHAGVVFRRRPSTPLLYAGALLQQALAKRGVIVEGASVVASFGAESDRAAKTAPGAAQPVMLAQHLSAPLTELLRPINKHSNNDYADRLLSTLGAQVYGGAPSMEKGVRALRGAMQELGVPEELYRPANGSGLGHNNRLAPEGLASLLRTLYLDPRIGPELMQSLSVGGVDGTTKHRFSGSIAARRVRAKTGTLNGKSCLAGYVGDESEILVFSIMVDRIRSRGVHPVRKAQVRVVDLLMGYAKGLVGETPEQEEGGTDYEVGEEVLESEEVEGTPEGEVPSADQDNADDEDNSDEEAEGTQPLGS